MSFHFLKRLIWKQ